MQTYAGGCSRFLLLGEHLGQRWRPEAAIFKTAGSGGHVRARPECVGAAYAGLATGGAAQRRALYRGLPERPGHRGRRVALYVVIQLKVDPDLDGWTEGLVIRDREAPGFKFRGGTDFVSDARHRCRVTSKSLANLLRAHHV